MERDSKSTTRFRQPHVDPAVAARNPQAAAYAKQMQARKGGDLRGGGPPVPIPPLNMPHVDGMTMADQALASRPAPPMGGIFTPDQVLQGLASPPQPSTGILTTDVLPEQARQDPAYREGHGSMYAVNQPHLAHKYGVLRNGQHIAPQMLQQGRPGLRPQTVEGIKAVQDFQAQRVSAEKGDAAAAKASAESPAGEAAKLAGGSSPAPVTAEEKAAAAEAMQKMDDFDFNSFRELMMKDLLNNDEQRRIIETRLRPLDLSELIINGRISQVIPVRPGAYEPELQSMTGEEELALKRLLMQEKKNLEAPDRYLLDKFQLMTVACGLRAINRQILPDHLDQKQQFNDELFWAKFNRVMKMPFHMLASLGVNYYWFDERVRKLFIADQIKNG